MNEKNQKILPNGNKLSIKFEFENFKCFENKMQIKSVFLKNHFDYI